MGLPRISSDGKSTPIFDKISLGCRICVKKVEVPAEVEDGDLLLASDSLKSEIEYGIAC